MASYDEVMTALRNADAAGATEDATRLAQIAQTMKSSNHEGMSHTTSSGSMDVKPTVQGEALNLMKGGASGAANLATNTNNALKYFIPGMSHDKTSDQIALEQFDKENKDSGTFKVGKAIAEIAGTAGFPMPIKSGATGLARIPQAIRNLTTGTSTGAMIGGAVGGEEGIVPGAAAGGGGALAIDALRAGGAGVSNVIGPWLPKIDAAKLLPQAIRDRARQYLPNALQGETTGAERTAGRIVTDKAVPNSSMIANLLHQAKQGETASQAAVDAGSSEFAGIQRLMESNKPSVAKAISDAQELKRVNTLKAVQPDESLSISARSAAANPLYDAARNSGNVVNTSPIITKIDDLVKRNPGNPELLNELKEIKSGLTVKIGNKIHPRVNAEQVASALDGIKAATAKKENKFILGKLVDIKDEITKAIPGMEKAQQKFSEMSPPVNQSKVIQSMLDVLNGQGGAERVSPFMNTLGRGETALLKKSTGAPRYAVGDLEKVLAPNQMDAVNKVSGELTRDLTESQLAKAGTSKALKIMGANESLPTLPGLVSWKVSTVNKLLRHLSGKGGTQGDDALSELMLTNPKRLADIMDSVNPTDKQILVKAILNRAAMQIPAQQAAQRKGE